MNRTSTVSLLAIIAAFAGAGTVRADTVFTYQGELRDAGNPAQGPFSMSFSLWDALTQGSQVGATIDLPSVPVVDGRFTVELDFGAGSFDNSGRWLEVAVNATTLVPRQPVTRAPYALQTRGIFVDDGNNVGIGTDEPVRRLHVFSSGLAAVLGDSSSPANDAVGVHGLLSATAPVGGFSAAVRGEHRGQNGLGLGVWGSHASSGTGVYGTAVNGIGVFGQSSSGGLGVFGIVYSGAGTGVHGRATAVSGNAYGVLGESAADAGVGVQGLVSSPSGVTFGIHGVSSSTTGRGVYGEASSTSGLSYAVRGDNRSTSGRGVYGYVSATSGLNYGVFGRTDSAAGYDFYAGGAGIDYGSPSSIRWKRNVAPIEDPLEKLARLRGVLFDWDAEHGGHRDIGMIAEEVGAVLPEIVQYEANGIDAIGMDYSKLAPLLVEAVNVLRCERDSEIASLRAEKDSVIAQLRTENDSIRAGNDALRARLDSLEQLVEQLISAQTEIIR